MIRRMMLVAGVLLVAFASAAHAQYPPGGGGFSMSSGTVASGGTVTMNAFGCPLGSTINFFVGGSAVGSAVTDVDGAATAQVTIDLPPGRYPVTNSCNDVNSFLTVTAADGTITGPPLPRTGAGSTLPLAKLAAVAITAGGLLLIVARKRAEALTQ